MSSCRNIPVSDAAIRRRGWTMSAIFRISILSSSSNLGLKDIHLIGNSLGGWLAADMAVRNANAVPQPDADHRGGHPR